MDFLEAIISDENDHLEHHGILGQRWGIRRFQNKDGSLTSAGKNRYGAYVTTTRQRHWRNAIQIAADTYSFVDSLIKVNGPLSLLSLNRDASRKMFDWGKAYVNDTIWKIDRYRSPVDSKTGLHLKTKQLSEVADLARVNPRYKTFNSDKHNNCALCTVTADLRKRGYDVTANPAGYGYMVDDYGRWYEGFEKETIDVYNDAGIPATSLSKEERIKATQKAIDKLMEELLKNGEGSRGVLGIHWSSGGHAVMWEVQDGRVKILDGQTGKIYTNPYEIIGLAVSIEYGRLDNLEPKWSNIKECCK